MRRFLLAGLLFLPLGFVCADEPDTENGQRDEERLREAGVRIDGSSLLRYLQQRTDTPEARARVGRLIEQLDAFSFQAREEATEALEQAGTSVLPALQAALAGASPEKQLRLERCIAAVENDARGGLVAPVVRLLRARGVAGADQALLDYLPAAQRDLMEGEVLDALLSLGFEEGRPRPVVRAALENREPSIRAAAAFLLGRSSDVRVRSTVEKLLTDADAHVRLRAAQGLLAAGEKKAVPVLIALVKDGASTQADEADGFLLDLAGEGAPSVEEHDKRAAAWQVWWKEHESRPLPALAPNAPLSQQSAGRVVRRAIQALFDGDGAPLRKVATVPFCGPVQYSPTREALDKRIDELCESVRTGRDGGMRIERVIQVVRLNEFKPPTMGGFGDGPQRLEECLKRLAPERRRAWAVHVLVSRPNAPERYEVAFFVTGTAEQPRIHGGIVMGEAKR